VILSGALLVYGAWVWWQAWGDSGERFERAAMLTLVTTCILAPRTATTDFVMMTPVLCALLGRVASRGNPLNGRGQTAAGALAAAGIEAALFIGLWALFLATVQGDQEQAVMYLPLPALLLGFLLIWRTARTLPEQAAQAQAR
jgi:hypothetical protein